MYKYKCAAEANADKEAFYGVVGGLKGLYPEMLEINNVPSDNEFLRREFVQGKNRVMVQYSFSERSVTVFSEEWLGKFYENRYVTEGRFYTYSYASTGTMWQISGIFFAVMIAASVIFYFLFSWAWYYDYEKNIIAVILVSAAVYTVSGIFIRRRVEIPLIKLIFCQAGGFITVGLGIFEANFLLLSMFFSIYFLFSAAELIFVFFYCFLLVFFPALEISFLIQAVIEPVIKKLRSSKAAAEENLEMNNDYKIIPEETAAEKNDYKADDEEKYLR